MSGFDAGTAVEALDWTFRPHIDASGIVPEPTEKEIRTFRSDLMRLTATAIDDVEESRAPDDKSEPKRSAREQVERMLSLTEGLSDQAIDIIVAITKGQPTREQIEALPGRLQQAFLGWLTGKLLDPQSATTDTKPSPVALRAV